MTAAINPADKSLIIVIELSLWMQHDVWLLAGEFMPKAQSRRAHPLESRASGGMSVSKRRIEIGDWIFPDHANVRQFCQFVARGQIPHVFMARPLLYRRATSVT